MGDSVNYKENRKGKCYKRKSIQLHEDQYSRHDDKLSRLFDAWSRQKDF